MKNMREMRLKSRWFCPAGSKSPRQTFVCLFVLKLEHLSLKFIFLKISSFVVMFFFSFYFRQSGGAAMAVCSRCFVGSSGCVVCVYIIYMGEGPIEFI